MICRVLETSFRKRSLKFKNNHRFCNQIVFLLQQIFHVFVTNRFIADVSLTLLYAFDFEEKNNGKLFQVTKWFCAHTSKSIRRVVEASYTKKVPNLMAGRGDGSCLIELRGH